MPLAFLASHDASAAPTTGDPLVAATPDGRIVVRRDGSLPTVDTLSDLGVRHLGTVGGAAVWGATVTEAPDGHLLLDWRDLTARLAPPLDSVVLRGAYDARWRHTHRFCGECGGALEDYPGFSTRRCPRCTTLRYVPQALVTVVLVAVEHADRLLLLRHAYGDYARHWALLAGFVEPGETLENAVAREVWEETGLELSSLDYNASQPRTLFEPGGMTVRFKATSAGAAITADPVEVAQARWFSRAEVRALPTELLPPTHSFDLPLIREFAD
ncbi:MAG TPA: NUDIX domain-containing protein [Asanoa sp.]|nr:NUDIX domain-containing protein [Asanoa sp.]